MQQSKNMQQDYDMQNVRGAVKLYNPAYGGAYWREYDLMRKYYYNWLCRELGVNGILLVHRRFF